MLVSILLHYFCEGRNKCYSSIVQTKELLSNTVIAAQLRIDLIPKTKIAKQYCFGANKPPRSAMASSKSFTSKTSPKEGVFSRSISKSLHAAHFLLRDIYTSSYVTRNIVRDSCIITTDFTDLGLHNPVLQPSEVFCAVTTSLVKKLPSLTWRYQPNRPSIGSLVSFPGRTYSKPCLQIK